MGEPIVVSGGPGRPGNRRVAIMGAVAVALLLIVVVLPRLVDGGGGGDDGTGDGAVLPPPTSLPVPDGDAPPETFEAFSGKNPFEPLVDVPVGSGGGAGADDGDTTPTTVVIDDGSSFGGFDDLGPVDDGGGTSDGGSFDDGGSVDGGGTTGGGTTGGGSIGGGTSDGGSTTTTTTAPPGPPPREPDRVSLLEVFRDLSNRIVASVRVNDTTYQVGEGEDFARSYRVLDLNIGRRCGTFLFGDDRFTLCEDDEVYKNP